MTETITIPRGDGKTSPVAMTFIPEHASSRRLLEAPVIPRPATAAALASVCGECGCIAEPGAVIDEKMKAKGLSVRGRYATYLCGGCGAVWLSWWPFNIEGHPLA